MYGFVWIVAIVPFGFVASQDVRLIPGPDKGRLEVLYNGTWGTVCQISFSNQAASVVCRSLNQSSQNAYRMLGYVYGVGSLKPRLSQVICSGLETTLSQCSLIERTDTARTCFSNNIVGIVCTNERMHALFKYGRNWFSSEQTLNIFEREYINCYSGNDSRVDGFQTEIREVTNLRYQRREGSSYLGVKRSDKEFTCTVSNWQMPNQDSMTIKVNVMYPPLDFLTSQKTVIEGSDVNISLTNIPNPIPHLTTWRKMGTRLQWNQTEAFRVYSNISRVDGGEFLVNISTLMNSSRDFVRRALGLELIYVDVQYQPSVKCQQEYFVTEGSKVDITCENDANPPPHSYIWTDMSGKVVYRGSKPSLVIDSVRPEDAGRYKCTAINQMKDSYGMLKSGLGIAELNIILGDQPPTNWPATTLSQQWSLLTPVTYAMIAVAVVSLVIVLVLVVVIVKLRRNKEPRVPAASATETSHGGPPVFANEAYADSVHEYTNLEFIKPRRK